MRPVSIEVFPGLDLRQDPGNSRGAIDLLNVTLEQGRIRSRDGLATFFTPSTVGVYLGLYESPGAAPSLIIGETGAPGTLRAVSSSGTSLGTTTTTNSLILAGASGLTFGGPTATTHFVALGGQVRSWNGAAWANPTASFPANTNVLSLSPTDNRLIACSNDGLCKVSFSDVGVPTTFGVNNWVELVPGDGQEIRGAAVFNNQTFVFKRSKFFVFYGTSTDPVTGNPIFNYRTVDAGIGMMSIAPQSICVGPDGVYFMSGDGIYRTTGGPPVKVSTALDPFFATTQTSFTRPPFFTGATWDPTVNLQRLAWCGECLYVGVGLTPSSSATLIYDRRLDAWSYADFATNAAVAGPSFAGNNAKYQLFVSLANAAALLRMTPGTATDNGAVMASRYRLPFESYGVPGRKHIRETLLEGVGLVTVQWSKDWGALNTGSSIQLGAAPTIADNRQRLGVRGNSLSLQLGAASGAWSVNRVQANFLDAISGPEINE